MRHSNRNTALKSAGLTIGLGGLSALVTVAIRKRFTTGLAKVKQLVTVNDFPGSEGIIVVMEDGVVFWAPEDLRRVLKAYATQECKPLPYRLDHYRRSRHGLPTGFVSLSD